MDVFNETLHSWQTFYFTTAAAAATLCGLMFVALSLGSGLINDKTRENFKVFVTPSIIYFVSAMLLSLVMLVPNYAPPVLATMFLVGGVMGLARTIRHVRHLIGMAKQYQDFDLWDWLTQIIGPVLSYVFILAAAVGFTLGQWELSFTGLLVTTIVLLVCAIANTWSLVIWIVDQRTNDEER